MVHSALIHSVKIIKIIFFVLLNILYAYVAIKVRKTKIDGPVKLILILNYLVFLRDFVSSVIDNIEGLTFSMFNITCFTILQMVTIIILSEAERVKLIITSKTSDLFVVGVKKVQFVKNVLFVFYLISLIISFFRLLIIYKFPEMNNSMLSPFIIAAIIDIIVNLLALIIILCSFYFSFIFFRDQYINNAGY